MLVAVWYFILAALLLGVITALTGFALPEVLDSITEGTANTFAAVGIGIGVIALILTSALLIIAGIGLINGKGWGWTLGIVVAVIGLLSFPFGTIIGVLVIIYLGQRDVRGFFGH